MYFVDDLHIAELISRGEVIDNDICYKCGITDYIPSKITPELIHFAKVSPIGLARYIDISHDDDHHRHIYFDREAQHVSDIILPISREKYLPKNNIPVRIIEKWKRTMVILKTLDPYCVTLTEAIKALNQEYNLDNNLENYIKTMSYITTLGDYGLVVSSGAGYHSEKWVSKRDGTLEINFGRIAKVIYNEKFDESPILQKLRKSKERPIITGSKFTLEWLAEHNYL